MDVGFEFLEVFTNGVSRGVPGNGEDERVVDEDVERYAESVKECSSAAVASRDPRSSPLSERLSS